MKNLFLIFISISFTLLGCKKFNNNEASQTSNQKYNFKKIDFSDVKNNKTLSKTIDIINRKNLSLHNGKNQTDSLFDFVIYFDEGILFDENGKHQYTFPVIRTNPNPNIQENALIIINPSGGIEAYLMRFHLNENDFLSFVNGNTNIQPAIDVIPINYNAYTNKSCYISYSAIYNVLYDDGCCQVIQYVGVDVTFMGDCAGGSGVFNDFGNGYNGAPEGGGGAAIGSFNINNIFAINGSLGLTQQQSNWINSHGFIKMKIFTYLINNNFSQSAKDFANSAISALINGDVNSFDELLNQEMSNNDQLEFDPIFWDNFNFQHQNLPSYNNFNNAYPRNMSGADVFQLVGGNVNNMAITNGWVNACATRVSRALNYSGVSIPNIPGKTFKGGDNKYYFVSAANLYRWIIGTFGQPTITLSGTQTHTDGSGFFTQANGQKGIYILIPNYPALFGASGHADIFDGQDFDRHGYFNASGGVHSVNLWVLP